MDNRKSPVMNCSVHSRYGERKAVRTPRGAMINLQFSYIVKVPSPQENGEGTFTKSD